MFLPSSTDFGFNACHLTAAWEPFTGFIRANQSSNGGATKEAILEGFVAVEECVVVEVEVGVG